MSDLRVGQEKRESSGESVIYYFNKSEGNSQSVQSPVINSGNVLDNLQYSFQK